MKKNNFTFTKQEKNLKKYNVDISTIRNLTKAELDANWDNLQEFLYIEIYNLHDIIEVEQSSAITFNNNDSIEYKKSSLDISNRYYAKHLFESAFISNDYIGGAFYFPNTFSHINGFNEKYKIVAFIPEIKKLSETSLKGFFNWYILLRDKIDNDIIIAANDLQQIYYRNKKIEKILQAQIFRNSTKLLSLEIDNIFKKYVGKTAGEKTRNNFNNELQQAARNYNLDCFYSFYNKYIEISQNNFKLTFYNKIVDDNNKFINSIFNIQVEQISSVSDFIKFFEADNISIEVECKKLYEKIRDLENRNRLIFQYNKYFNDLHTLNNFYNRLEI